MGSISKDIPGELRRAFREMPAISPVLGKINRISREMDTSPRDLVKIIMLDPVITGNVIKLVNSSFYGLAQRVNSLGQAVVLLGVNTVKNLAITTALLGTVFIEEKCTPLPHREFWQHCLAVAIASRALAKELKPAPGGIENYFIAGLLHDVGKILFVKADPGKYEKAIDESRSLGVSLDYYESVHFDCTHAQVGAVLARQWKLDDSLVEVVEFHHDPRDETISPLLGLIIIANNLCKRAQIGESGNPMIEEIADDLCHRLGIGEESLNRVMGTLPLELEKAAEFLECIKEEKES
ncbi:MAG: HDOD domain-containing protein [bacterium]|nr:HDOD domain-containing protein [bacterium]